MKKTRCKVMAITMAMTMLFGVLLPYMAVGANAVSPSPHLLVNLESRMDIVGPGQEILVDIEMCVLSQAGWTSILFDIYYDNTKLEWIAYDPSLPFVLGFIGRDQNQQWVQMFGRVSTNQTSNQIANNLSRRRIAFGIIGDHRVFPAETVTVTLRFRVLDNAAPGETVIRWVPPFYGHAFLPDATHPNPFGNLYFAPPTPESYTQVMIAPSAIAGTWVDAPGEGWVFYAADTGERHIGWLSYGGEIYFLNAANNGVMVRGTRSYIHALFEINGLYHVFLECGAWQGIANGWYENENREWYFFANGIRKFRLE